MTAKVVAGAALTLSLAMPTAAFANDYTSEPPQVTPKTLGAQFEQPAVAAAASSQGQTLPFTGTDVAEMALIGAGAVLTGVVAVRRSRRSTTQA